ncbi:hypothetical protein DUT90_06060 [Polaribacter sp. WD7]|uniref:hypothetical protein n=1 Tax=Polaribacter sp. WD7 TaxID=2269061 RepID=UPI000DF2B8D9|nr:hypothetical protein [Polaribacter sp. WD7]RCS27668.1 hypothetical protein DUT90_06060 [Polaribacter sp. WD7]
MNNQKEIVTLQKKQKNIKKEIQVVKKKLPTYVIAFLFFASISLYFLEERFYNFFGNSVKLVIIIILIASVIFLLFLIKLYINIKTKQKESKNIGSKLYKLMKLEVKNDNE